MTLYPSNLLLSLKLANNLFCLKWVKSLQRAIGLQKAQFVGIIFISGTDLGKTINKKNHLKCSHESTKKIVLLFKHFTIKFC